MRRILDSLTHLHAFFLFHYFDLVLRWSSFDKIYLQVVREEEDNSCTLSAEEVKRQVDVLTRSIRIIRRFDLRRRRECLPRALAVHRLLCRGGVPAKFRLGIRTAPFGAHAWVEVHGEVVSDYGDEATEYQQLTSAPAAQAVGS